MYTKYHLKSAQDLNTHIIEAIKVAFQSKPITIIVEEDETDFELTTELQAVLDKRLQEDGETYLTGKDSIKQLNKKYGL